MSLGITCKTGMKDCSPPPNLTGRAGGQHRRAMRLAGLRRFAWLLVLVLSAGIAAPLLASATSAPPASVHVHAGEGHADGAMHYHEGAIGQRTAQIRADAPGGQPVHCLGCLTGAACALSCLGVAVLPVNTAWSPPALSMAWTSLPAGAPVGVAPPGDADPPRPVPVR